MNIKKLILSGIAMSVVIAAAIVFIFSTVKAGTNLTAEQAQLIVLNEQVGEVLQTELIDKDYVVTLQKTQGIYQFVVSQHKEQITAITQLERFVADVGNQLEQELDDVTKPIATDDSSQTKTDGQLNIEPSIEPSTDTDKEPNRENTVLEQTVTLISKLEAKEIALQQVAGIVDDIELEKKGELRFYLVEIEVDDQKDAIVQIHAITGKVMSVTWDSSNDDDDDDNNDDDDDNADIKADDV